MPRFRGTMAQQILRLPMFAAGMPGRERLLAALTPTARTWMLSPLMPNEWYDERLAVELTHALYKVLNLSSHAALQTWFRRQHLQAYAGTVRASGSVGTPESVLATLPGVWSRQHDTGTLSVEELTPLSARVVIRDNPDVADELYAIALVGGTEAFLTLAGAQGLGVTHSTGRMTLTIECAWEGVASGHDAQG